MFNSNCVISGCRGNTRVVHKYSKVKVNLLRNLMVLSEIFNYNQIEVHA